MEWLPGISGIDRFVVDVALRAAVVLAVAGAAALALRLGRASAASRHAMWTLAACAVIVLPLLTAFLPALSLELPFKAAVPAAGERVASPPPSPPPSAPSRTEIAAAQAADRSEAQPGVPADRTSSASLATAPANEIRPAASGSSPAVGLFGIWWIGAGLSLVPAALALASLRRLGRASQVVKSGPLLAALDRARERLGFERAIRLLESRERCMPMTWGLWRPTILVPEEATGWSSERLEIVMLHELAHVRRRDCLIQLLAQAARAVHWFNPLSWLAERRLGALKEEACDDQVLATGFGAPDYAEHLLAVSASCRAPAFAAGLAMARSSKLERRLVSILNVRRNRRPIGRLRFAAAALAAAALLAPLSMARFHAAKAAEPPAPVPAPGGRAETGDALSELRAKIKELNAGTIDEKEVLRGAIKGMVGALHDPYSDYLTPEMLADMETQVSGKLFGIGAYIGTGKKQLLVRKVLEDSPAMSAGLKRGDLIVQIDGAPAAGLDAGEAVKLIRGPAGTMVRLLIAREGQDQFEVAITRGPVKIPSVVSSQKDTTHHIGFIQFAQFGSATPQELRAAVGGLEAQGLKGLILDLRSCPGGLLESAVAAANLFIGEGTIVSIHARTGEPTVFSAKPSDHLTDMPMVVLVNGETASAAEIVAGALKDHHRALVVGTRTLGKGSVQSLIPLEDGNGAIKLTTSHYHLPGGSDIDRKSGEKSWGIDPDEGFFIPREQSPAEKSDDADPAEPGDLAHDSQLAAALETLVARLESGQWKPAGGLGPAEIEAFLKREDAQRKRASIEKEIERLRHELSELEQ